MKKIKISLFFLSLSFVFILGGCLKKDVRRDKPMTLEVWGIFDDSDVFAEINTKYTQTHPGVRINYKKISSNEVEYERQLVDALANGNGPDVFFFHNTWLPKHGQKIVALPNSKNWVRDFRESFMDVAENDFIENDNIYAMPLFCDTLALFYNKNLLNQAGIASPPKTWKELSTIVPRLTQIDKFGNIQRSGIALGRSKDPGAVNRSTDIIASLMMQNGVALYDKENRIANFNYSTLNISNPGIKALDYYTSFARGGFPQYTWNAKMDFSIDSFRFGQTAMMINYAYLIKRLRFLDPKFDFSVSSFPQRDLNNRVDYANYWGLAVAKNKNLIDSITGEKLPYTQEKRINEAWQYIWFVTMPPKDKNSFDANKDYLDKTGKPAARLDLIEAQKGEPELGIFARQALTARSWYQIDKKTIENILAEMIDDVVAGRATSSQAINTAQARINTLGWKEDRTFK